jgi:predicted RNase H-like nuclease (RuvC/YqgF family)
METVEVAKTEYDRLQETARVADENAEKVRDLEKDNERLETDLKKANDEKAELQSELDKAKEVARQDELAKTRLDALGEGFTEKLGEKTKARLQEQARTMQDEEWDARLDELEEITNVKRDADKDGESGGDGDGNGGQEFSKKEIASFQGKGGKPDEGEVSPAARRSVIGSLAKL